MKVKLVFSIIMVCLVTADGFGLNNYRKGDVNARHGRKYLEYGVLDYNDVFNIRAYAKPGFEDSLRHMPLLKAHEAKPYQRRLSMGKTNTFIAPKGTKVEVPPNAFVDLTGRKVTGFVDVYVREIYSNMDFLTSPVGLTYRRRGKTSYFQSDGMFEIQAKAGRRLKVAPGKQLNVFVPNPNGNAPDAFGRYHLVNGNWRALPPTKSGQAAVAPANAEEEEFPGRNPDTPRDGKWECPPSECPPSHRVIAATEMGWYNFDQPYDYVACLKGTIINPLKNTGEGFEIITVGVDYKGIFTRFTSDGSFKINAHLGKKVKVIVVDKKGNIGVSKVIQVSNRRGFDKNPEGPKNYHQPIGTITLKAVPQKVLKDRQALAKYLSI